MSDLSQEIGYIKGRIDALEARQHKFEDKQTGLHETLTAKIDEMILVQKRQIGFVAGAAFAFSILWAVVVAAKDWVIEILRKIP
jgi:hypothetical protein